MMQIIENHNMNETKRIPLADCKHGYLYKIRSRNLLFGVFNEKSKGFIGIREKFGHEYLFTEYHHDTGPPFGTVSPISKMEKVPDDIEIKESLGSFTNDTNQEVAFDKPVSEGGKGWYFVGTGEDANGVRSGCRGNQPLEDWLQQQRNERSK